MHLFHLLLLPSLNSGEKDRREATLYIRAFNENMKHCLRMRPVAAIEGGHDRQDRMVFQKATGCSSSVGNQHKPQLLRFKPKSR